MGVTQPRIDQMFKVWDKLQTRIETPIPQLKVPLEEIISSVFMMGPSYYYFFDFSDMSISGISSGFREAHGVEPEQIKHIGDVLSLIHPDDMEFVAKAEERAYQFIYQKGLDKVTFYKASYNHRFKTADGSYRLFNHQALILSVDENNHFIRSINIHTDISHITQKNNYKWSAIGLGGEPSYVNLDVRDEKGPVNLSKPFSSRELEVIKLIATGCSSREIAEKLFISHDTVKVHRKHIFEKSGCANAAELAARSVSEGWV